MSSPLEEYLVALGYKVDKNSEKTFLGSVLTTTGAVTGLIAAAQAAAVAVTAAVEKIARGLEDLYFSSQRTKASAENIRAFGYAASQLGSSVEAAVGSLESVARFIRNNPGALDLLNGRGIRTRNQDGSLRDTVDMMSDLGDVLRNMPYYQANVLAQTLGIDERTLMAMREGLGDFGKQYHEMLKAAGLDEAQATKDAHGFMVEIRGLGNAIQVLVQKVGALVFGDMTLRLKAFREQLVGNFEVISKVITNVVNVLLTIASTIAALVDRAIKIIGDLIGAYQGLDESTKNLLKTVGLLAAAWAGLNFLFGLTPVGRILALGVAILALYDDYKVWAEGGNSLFNWGEFENEIQLVVDVFKAWAGYIKEVVNRLNELQQKLDALTNNKFTQILTLLNPVSLPGSRVAAARGLFGPGGEEAPAAAGSSLTDRFHRFLNPERKGAAAGGINAQSAVEFFVKSGWTKDQAAGIVSNIAAESNFNHQALGDRNPKTGQYDAFGLAQWHPDRQAAFRAWLGKDIRQSTPQEQLGFIHYELTQGAYRGAGTALRGAQNADQAGRIVSNQYEIPLDPDGAKAAARGAAAVTISQKTDIHLYGTNESAARQVTEAQKDVNQQIVRNTQGAVF